MRSTKSSKTCAKLEHNNCIIFSSRKRSYESSILSDQFINASMNRKIVKKRRFNGEKPYIQRSTNVETLFSFQTATNDFTMRQVQESYNRRSFASVILQRVASTCTSVAGTEATGPKFFSWVGPNGQNSKRNERMEWRMSQPIQIRLTTTNVWAVFVFHSVVEKLRTRPGIHTFLSIKSATTMGDVKGLKYSHLLSVGRTKQHKI